MCQFEDWPIISKYTRQQAVDDGGLVEALSWNGILVMATIAVRDDCGLIELLTIWHKFLAWKDMEEPKLPVEERLFSIQKDDKKIWVIEDAEAFTMMYPHEY